MHCPRCHRRYPDDSRFCHHDGEPLASFVDLDRLHVGPCEQAGSVISERYRIHGLIGRGATAYVFLARDLVSGEAVAVKVLDRRHARDRTTAARLLLEAKAIASITHTNVIEVFDVGYTAGLPYVVMEYLFGESLGDALRRETSMPLTRGLSIVRQIAAGLAAAHGRGILHRDVKPDNIFLLGEKGDAYAVKVVDFGFAKVEDQRGMTQAGVTLGTIEYMAPEQAVGDGPEPASDVYALGVLMYRLFVGRLPFEGSGQVDVLAQHLVVAPPPPDLGPTPMGRGVAAIILKALRKNPENRYRTMSDLAQELDRVAVGMAARASSEPADASDAYTPKSAFATHVAGLFRRKAESAPSS
jgi:serine/threonine-protein kinase